MKRCSVIYCIPSAVVLALLALAPAASQAEFVLNFMPEASRFQDPEWLNFNCNRPRAAGGGFESCDENDEFRDDNGRDRTAFLMERVRDPASYDQYYHTIVGLPGDDFYQEAYIKITRYPNKDGGGMSSSPPREIDDLGPISDSLGDWRSIKDYRNNAYDPMGPARFSGSGTANPNSTQFRQVIDSAGVFQDITKAYFTRKHRIVQNIDTSGVHHEFDLDMTNSTFDQGDIAGLLNKNYLVVSDAGDFISEFDINAIDQAGVNVTGGKYVFHRLYETSINGTSFENEYSGEGAGYNIWEENWKIYYDPSQNTGHLYSCGKDCNGSGYDPYLGGRTWSKWSSSRKD